MLLLHLLVSFTFLNYFICHQDKTIFSRFPMIDAFYFEGKKAKRMTFFDGNIVEAQRQR
jgi:hypothetical protein